MGDAIGDGVGWVVGDAVGDGAGCRVGILATVGMGVGNGEVAGALGVTATISAAGAVAAGVDRTIAATEGRPVGMEAGASETAVGEVITPGRTTAAGGLSRRMYEASCDPPTAPSTASTPRARRVPSRRPRGGPVDTTAGWCRCCIAVAPAGAATGWRGPGSSTADRYRGHSGCRGCVQYASAYCTLMLTGRSAAMQSLPARSPL